MKKTPAEPRKIGELTRKDRLQICIECMDKAIPRDDCSVYFDVAYKGYVHVGIKEAMGGAVYFLRREKGKWKVIERTQDQTSKSFLIKLGVPEDVQKVVWGNDIYDDTKESKVK